MNVKVIAALAAGLLSAAPAFSAPVVLDFEGVPGDVSIGDFYASQGVTFDGDLLAFTNQEGFPIFSNAPTNGSIMGPVNTLATTMNVAAGFAGTASFFYSSDHAASVNIYSGLNGTGSILGTFDLLANSQDGCSDTLYCHWDQLTLDFGGIAQSIQFNVDGNGVGVGFDNIAVAPVPLPAAIWLLGSSLIGLGGVARRRKQA